MIDFDDIFIKIAVFEELFDKVRIVDPLRKKVLDVNETRIQNRVVWCKYTCFFHWKKLKICENCISMRALVSREEEMKFEFDGNCGYLVTAKPFKLGNQEYVMEFVKKLDKITLMKEFETRELKNVESLINKFNEETIKDSLTKIYNKKFVNERIPHEIAYSILENKSICFAMGDIDFFNNVNDKYGHLCGDRVLEKVAELLSERLGDGDWVARFGGEEFLIFLKGKTEEDVSILLEEARIAIENKSFVWEDKTFGVTISFGSIYLKNVDTYNIEGSDRYIDIADKNIKRAKNMGRNRIVLT